ncbi:MerR family transcriptional regulator [Beijerinckia indica]|uniref:Transcriptional regulator, MerR family n=1 Tax=Beijerinckia indica subsp. indica (strain ATCC 9039 / DSM 1715 / NCIMB 8712) TaxID=395963 RepID=B2IEJ2_BEII9|nr:MerR family transcriptional regulator [Beijerinckia indica]ACB96934.1 transcriptional regulator, MerR family [Beijerinckia indica subsp. indica ATCC 9039]
MEKKGDAFRTISEAADELDLPPHVLRFWETRFPQIKPLKRGGGRRYYRPVDIELLQTIRIFLYDQGYTIKGVQRLLHEQGPRGCIAAAGRLGSNGQAAGDLGQPAQDCASPGTKTIFDEAVRDDVMRAAPASSETLLDEALPEREGEEYPFLVPASLNNSDPHVSPQASSRIGVPGTALAPDDILALQALLEEIRACEEILAIAIVSN